MRDLEDVAWLDLAELLAGFVETGDLRQVTEVEEGSSASIAGPGVAPVGKARSERVILF